LYNTDHIFQIKLFACNMYIGRFDATNRVYAHFQFLQGISLNLVSYHIPHLGSCH
jgi:hypothetical protein